MSPATVLPREGPLTEPEYPTEDVSQGPFSFGASGFLINDIFRESGTHLTKLLFPETLRSEKARKSAQDDASVIDISWIKAQLQHYGINFSPDVDHFQAKALLLTSVAYGLCDTVPPQILKIKNTLKKQYIGTMEEYRAKLKMYRAQELPKRILRFEACLIPTEEVICDASLFLQKYFLNEDGSPDQTKTPGLVLLPGYTDRHLALTGRTEPVPALHVADGGLGGASNVMVIGWDRARVNNKAHKIDMEQSHGVGVLRLSHDWDRLMMSHQSYAEKLRNQAEIRNPQTGSSFKAHNVRGKYVVKSDAIQDDWPLLAKELRLRVVANGRLAIFDLGIIVGLMVLGKTQEHVTKVIKDGKWNADLLGVEELEDESEKEDSSSDEESDGDDETNDERASGCSGDSDYNIGDDPEAPIDLTSDQQVERQQNQKRHPRRLYFQWRGYNTMSGAIQFDPQNRNTGYLDFANDDATVFEGHICTNDMGGEISFRGYGVPGICGPLTMNWNAFSHLASERAKVPEYVR